MKPTITAGIVLAMLLNISFTVRSATFHIDGYVVTETKHYVVSNQIVELTDESGNQVAWFITGDNGLFSGTFMIDDWQTSSVFVSVSRTCDQQPVVYTQEILLDNPYLVCNFFVCEYISCHADFYYTQIDGNDLVFQFTDVSTGNITSWLWDFGDQQTSTLQNPVHQYQNEDHYDVTLEITTDSCTDTRNKWLHAFPTDCLADFTYEQVNQGSSLFVHFFDESIGDYNHIHWDFGDGSAPSNQPDPWHKYDEAGDYEVELHIWKQGGGGPDCDHVTRKIVRVQPASTCYALFTSEQNHAGIFEIQFTDVSIGASNSWVWTFGDETTSFEQNPVHIYENPGEYLVHFFISGAEGMSSFSRVLQVQESNSCIPGFSYLQPSVEQSLIFFENLSIGENLEFIWDFGDGETSTDTTPEHWYANAGVYDVTLTATGFGCSDSIIKQVEVLSPPPCHAAFSYSSQNPEPNEIFFTNESTGMINSYFWEFGDGHFSSEENPVHIYDGWGNYTVWLTIDAIGCQDSVEHLVQIAEPEYCQAVFSFAQANPQLPVITFTNESTGIDFTSFWDFGDGNYSSEESPEHDFMQWGNYNVWLKIETFGGCKDSVEHVVQIAEPEFCNAVFSFVQEYPQNPVVTFANESTGYDFSSVWDFGDGVVSEETHPQHQYEEPGEYLVKLTIETPGSCTDSALQTVEILPPLTINGSVMAGPSLFGYGDLFLLKTDSPDGFVVYDQQPLGTGTFEFTGLTPGNYLLQAIPVLDFPFPVIPNYLPTYYGNASYWEMAGSLQTNNLPGSVIISLLAFDDFFNGNAGISGVVNLLSDENSPPVLIYIMDESDQISDYRVVDSEGNFTFDEIPYGTYRLIPEKAGKTGVAVTLHVDERKPESHETVFIESADRIYPDLTSVNKTEYGQIMLYPNPAKDRVQIHIEEHLAGNGTLHILNTSGTNIISFDIIPGKNTLDVASLSNGIYFACFRFENQSFNTKLIIQH